MTARPPVRKTVFIDIETYTDKVQVYATSRWKQNIVEFDEMWRVASIAYQKLEIGESGERHFGEINAMARSGARGAERPLVRLVRNLFDWADLVVAHNAKFDVGKMRAKFVEYQLSPPSGYQVFCTYNATRSMGFPSKKLDDLGHFLGLGRKVPTLGKDTWGQAYDGDDDALELLQRYNIGDVELLVLLYDRLRPYVAPGGRPVIRGIVPNEAPENILSPKEAGRIAKELYKEKQRVIRGPRKA